MPLFPGYVFVRLALRNRLRVLQIPGLVRLVGFSKVPTPLPERDIEALRDGFAAQLRVEPHRYLTIGRRVRIKSGPLEGLEGILIRKKNAVRVVLSIELIMHSASVEIDAGEIERIG